MVRPSSARNEVGLPAAHAGDAAARIASVTTPNFHLSTPQTTNVESTGFLEVGNWDLGFITRAQLEREDVQILANALRETNEDRVAD